MLNGDKFIVKEWDDSEWVVRAFDINRNTVGIEYEDGLRHVVSREYFTAHATPACSVCGYPIKDGDTWECPGCGSI